MKVRPRLQLLSSEQINDVHRYSIRILEDTGFEVESEEYSLEKEIEEILRQPLVDILVALMLINDLFRFFRHEI